MSLQANAQAKPNSRNPRYANVPKPVVGQEPVPIPEHVWAEICRRTYAGGESQRSISRDPDMPGLERIRRECVENPVRGGQYARAREGLYLAWAEEILDISDDGTTDYVTKVGRNGHEYQAVDQEHIQRSRLRVETRKWLLSKLLPKQYGDKVEHTGDVQHTVTHTLSDREKMRRMALFMLEGQTASDGEVVERRTCTNEVLAAGPGVLAASRALDVTQCVTQSPSSTPDIPMPDASALANVTKSQAKRRGKATAISKE
jgi:hypothetical protein